MPTSGSSRVVVLDTSAYTRLRRGHDRLADAIAQAERVLLPTIVLGEIEAGFLLGSRMRENRKSLDDFLSESFVEVVNVTPAVARRYATTFAALRRAGTPIPTNDIWIAACALENGALVLSFDGDFERVSELAVTVFSVDG